MKKLALLVLAIILIVPVLCCAQSTWRTANQVTMAWDAVTPPVSGTLGYGLYQFMPPQARPVQTDTPLAVVNLTQYQYTFSVEGKYILGVKTIRYDTSSPPVQVSDSPISWSDDAMVCQGGVTFGIIYYLSPAKPTGLR